MKKLVLIILSFIAVSATKKQNKPLELDKSPMDISYFPTDYPLLKLNGKAKEEPFARIIYSRPQKNGRTIFNGIVKLGEMWRLGANEATEIELFKPAIINKKVIAKGKYTLYCIPYEDKWTLILNKDNYCWGNFNYDLKKDVVRLDCKVQKTTEITEVFTVVFEETKTKTTHLNFMWDDVKVQLPITF